MSLDLRAQSRHLVLIPSACSPSTFLPNNTPISDSSCSPTTFLPSNTPISNSSCSPRSFPPSDSQWWSTAGEETPEAPRQVLLPLFDSSELDRQFPAELATSRHDSRPARRHMERQEPSQGLKNGVRCPECTAPGWSLLQQTLNRQGASERSRDPTQDLKRGATAKKSRSRDSPLGQEGTADVFTPKAA